MQIYWGIRKKLLLLTALTILPLLVITVMITADLVARSYAKHALQLQGEKLRQVGAHLDFLARMAESDVVFLSRLQVLNVLSQASRDRGGDFQTSPAFHAIYGDAQMALMGFINSKQVYDQARLLSADGREILRVNLVDGRAEAVPREYLQDKSDRYYFSEAVKLPAGRVYVSHVDLNREEGQIEKPLKPVLRFATPLRDAGGALTGVVVLNFYAERLLAAALTDVTSDHVGSWIVMDQGGSYLYYPRHPERLWGAPRDLGTGQGCSKDFGDACATILRGGMARVTVDGAQWEAYSRVVSFPGNPDKLLAVVHLLPDTGMFGFISQVGQLFLVALLVAILGAILLAWASGRMVSSPLIRLAETMKRFSENDWSARTDLKSNDELGMLAAGFNGMAGRLQTIYGELESRVAERTAELETANQRLMQSEAQARAILDNTVDAIITIDTRGVVQSFNKGAEKLFGYQAEEVIGHNIKMLQPADVAAHHDQYLARYLETGEAHIIGKEREERGRRKDGSIFPMYLAVSEVRLKNVIYFTGIIRDTTELRKAERDLYETMRLFQANFELAAVGIAHVAPDGAWLRVNDKLCQIVGYDRGELMGMTFQDITHPDDLGADLDLVRQVLAGEIENYAMEKRYLKKDGSIVWVNLTVSLVHKADGSPSYFISVVEDISQRRMAEIARAESEKRFRTLVANVPGAVYRCANDRSWSMRYISQPIQDISGYPAEDFIGNRRLAYADIIHPGDRQRVEDEVQQALEKGEGFELEYRIVRQDGQVRWVYEKGQLVTDEDGAQWLDGAILETTERKQAEEENVRLGRLLDESLNEIYICDADTLKFIHVNQGARQNLGYSMDEMRRMTPLDIKPEFTPETYEALIKPLRDGQQQRVDFSTYHRRKDGTTYPVEVSLQFSPQAVNQVLVAVIQDVTEKNKVREEIKRLSLVAKRTDNLVMILNQDAVIQWVNDAFVRTSGYAFEEAVGKRPTDFLPGPDSDLDTVAYMEAQLRQGKGVNVEVVDYTKGGRKYWVALSVQPVFDAEGRTTNFVSVGSDISERKRIEQELRQQAQIIDQTHDAVISINLERRMVSWNRGAHTLFGYAPQEVLGQHVARIMTPEGGSQLDGDILGPVAHGGQREFEVVMQKKSGESFTALLSLSVLSNLRGEPTGYVGYVVDISERKKAEEAVRRAKESAETANRIKSEFLANMSHELRTPLNAIIGFSEILLDQTFGELNPKQARQTQHILDSGRHLLSLINDILDLSKVESGKMELELSVVSLPAVLESSVVLIKEKTGKHGIALKLELTEPMRELSFPADERKLKQILFNLLSNAAKFTPDGGSITVNAQMVEDTLQISVSDTGVGIEEKDQARIFDEFEQVDSTYGRQQQGTGLGLALTRKLVELHGGRVWVESAGKDRGSTFTFTIPLRAARAAAPAEPGPGQAAAEPAIDRRGAGRGVLVIDDDPMARELLSGYLEEDGYEVSLAADGAMGLEMAKRLLPSAITLDIMLPDISGFEVLRQLREDPVTTDIPVILVSITDDREKGISLGATDFLQKPVEKRHLLNTIYDQWGCGRGGFHKVLVVDDNPDDIEMVTTIMSRRGCTVIGAASGEEGVEKALGERPDLIILDLNMPGVSGWDVLEALAERGEGWRPPVLVFTGTDLTSQERRQLAGMVQAVVLKGGGKEELLNEVNRLTQMSFDGR